MAQLEHSVQLITAADFYDLYGDREFARPSLGNYVSELVHRSYMTKVAGRVLEVGAGVGRFTVPLAKRCSSMVVMDISSRQLERNRSLLASRGLLSKVERHSQGDVSELTELDDASFDVVVCFRGPLNYCVKSYGDAMRELFRVLRSGGQLLLSVRTVFSGVRPYVDSAFRMGDAAPLQAVPGLLASHKLEHPTSPSMRLFTASETMELVRICGGRVERVSGDGVLAPWLDAGSPRQLWCRLMHIERRLADDPFGIANANHLILAARKN